MSPLKPNTQKAKLLLAYDDHRDVAMNWSQALSFTDIHPRACAWKRVGDLAREGFLELAIICGIVLETPGDLGSLQRCYVITEAGKRAAKELRT